MHWRVPKPGIVAAALAVVMVAMVILGTDPMPTWRVTKQLRQAADAWAQAVCGRDGNRIAELCTKEVREQLKQEELLSGTEGDYSFGWSSPWPWEAQYRMIECKPQETVILYYTELFAPQTAARILLNLAENEEKVAVSAGDIQADGSVEVSVAFQEEGKQAAVKMIQPYGTDGIWIPQD